MIGGSIVAISALLALVLTKSMIVLSPKLGLVDVPSERRIHKTLMPRAGGIAVWVTLMVCLALLALTGVVDSGGLGTRWMVGFAGASSVIFVVGVLDDRRGIPARWKLLGQILSACVFFALCGKSSGSVLGFPVHWAFELIIWVGWAVLLINAFNLIDGMDGLCAGLGLISCLCLAGLSFSFGRVTDACVILVMVGALAGFLFFNFHPARIFLGDTGSMLIGLFIATIASSSVGERAASVSLLLPLLVAGVPLFDVFFAVWRRTVRAKANALKNINTSGLFEADKDHLHHRLLASGFSQKKAVWLLYGVSLVFAVVVLFPFVLDERALGLSATLLGVVALMGFRYVAPVELRVSGDLLHLALKRPGSSRLIAACYFCYDFLVIVTALTISLYVENSGLVRLETFTNLWKEALVVVSSCLIALRFAKSHSRHWSRATLRDVISLLVWFIIGLTFAFTASTFLSRDLAWSNFRIFVFIGMIGGLLFMIPRVITVVLRELIVDSQHRSLFRSKGLRKRLVIYGAGDLGELFLHHLKVTEPTQLVEHRLIGFIDDNPNLAGRYMDGFKIFGGIEKLTALEERFGLSGILLCSSNLEQKNAEKLSKIACELGLKVYRWEPNLKTTVISLSNTLRCSESGILNATQFVVQNDLNTLKINQQQPNL